MDIRFFNIKNPWRTGGSLPVPSIRRSQLDDLDSWLKDDDVVVIYGPRRIGKSTLLYSITIELLHRYGVAAQDIYFFDLDTLDCSDILTSPGSLIDFIGIPERRTYVIIDEVQRLENPGLLLKGLRDLDLPLKIIVSGSSSLEIRSKVRETLAGRKRIIRLGGLGWNEYRAVQNGEKGWYDFLVYGAYPAVVLAGEVTEKRRLLLEYYESYLDRDIDRLLRVDRLDVFREFITLLASQVGSLVNLNDLAGTLRVSRDTLARYLFYLEETFVLRRLTPFVRNPRKEISKMPKMYFTDCGWRNLVSTGFVDLQSRADLGALLENAVENWLRSSYPLSTLYFWRTETKAEVDFVVDDGGVLRIFEVKAKNMGKPTVPRSMRSFIKMYRPEDATIINLSLETEVEVEGLGVKFRTFPECMENPFFDNPVGVS